MTRSRRIVKHGFEFIELNLVDVLLRRIWVARMAHELLNRDEVEATLAKKAIRITVSKLMRR